MKKIRAKNGFGLGQIMATLLVVLPTLAFLVTFMFDYWAVMQEDNKLKLMANMVSTELDDVEDLSLAGLNAYLQTSEGINLVSSLNSLCPTNTNIVFNTPRADAPAGIISTTLSYHHVGRYFDKVISTNMSTYSYHDQNATIDLICR